MNFEQLWLDNLKPLLNYIACASRSRQDAEDILQSVTITAIQSFDGLKNKRAFRGWIFKIARHAICDYYGRNHPKYMLVDMGELEACLSSLSATRFEDSLVNEIIIRDFMNQLPAKWRDVLYLSLYLGVGIGEISKITGTSYAMTQYYLRRIKKELANALEGDRVRWDYLKSLGRK